MLLLIYIGKSVKDLRHNDSAHELENRDCIEIALILVFNLREGSLKMVFSLPIFFFSPFSLIRKIKIKNKNQEQRFMSLATTGQLASISNSLQPIAANSRAKGVLIDRTS